MSQNTNQFAVAGLVLAAGKGTRMKSALPKVLHNVAGRPMLAWVLRTLADAGVGALCAVMSEDIAEAFERDLFAPIVAGYAPLHIAIQQNRLGTGDAVAAAAWSFAGVKPAPFAAGYALAGGGKSTSVPIECQAILIMAGDTPAVQPEQLATFLADFRASGAGLGVLGMQAADPTGYGRLVLKGEQLQMIVEERDADAPTRAIDICNTGVMVFDKALLFKLLHALTPNNSQREYYLTDCIRHANEQGIKTMAHVMRGADLWRDFAGINDRAQLAAVEAWLVKRRLRRLMQAGVTVHLPDTVYIEADVEVAVDCEIGAGCHLLGTTRIGSGARIGPGSVLSNCNVMAGEILPPLTLRGTSAAV